MSTRLEYYTLVAVDVEMMNRSNHDRLNEEIVEVDRWVRAHTVERFGPVRSVEPVLVFELGFEGIGPSPRHKSGVAVRFPRMLRRRLDKTAAEADTLVTLRNLARTASSNGSFGESHGTA